MKRSQRYNNSPESYSHHQNEPHYNTYYRPVGKPPKKKKSKRIFKNIYYFSHPIRLVYWFNVFLII